MTEGRKVVWVLGAGFSQPLGGPLLPYLLSAESRDDLRIRFRGPAHQRLHDKLAMQVRSLKQAGLTAKLWRDAEQFIDYLDTAANAEGSPAAIQMDEMIGAMVGDARHPPIDEYREAARRLVAAECSAFLEGVDIGVEQWDPFRAWAGELCADDTVITFNYDRVLEMLEPPWMKVAIPGADHGEAREARLGHILKLHGSVDWQRQKDGGLFERHKDRLFAVTCADKELAIATPGPTKRKTSRELEELWTMAESALGAAEAIVFVGYRFPESDAEARTRLLNAIESNRNAGLRIHVVLGPRGHDSERLAHLLGLVCQRAARTDVIGGGLANLGHRTARQAIVAGVKVFEVLTHPLWSQDFLSVWKRQTLFF